MMFGAAQLTRLGSRYFFNLVKVTLFLAGDSGAGVCEPCPGPKENHAGIFEVAKGIVARKELRERGERAVKNPNTLEYAEAVKLLRRNLKVLLFHLARGSETPSAELENILQDVIYELYTESKQALEERKSHLRLVQT